MNSAMQVTHERIALVPFVERIVHKRKDWMWTPVLHNKVVGYKCPLPSSMQSPSHEYDQYVQSIKEKGPSQVNTEREIHL